MLSLGPFMFQRSKVHIGVFGHRVLCTRTR